MGFYLLPKLTKSERGELKGYSAEFLHQHGCTVCPLSRQKELLHPSMPASGTKHPKVYFIGEAPGAQEDRKGKQFVGSSGNLLRKRLPDEWFEHIRWNNVVRTRPPNNRTPTPIEIECCRPSIIQDIERTKPKAIFGFGAVPLWWAMQQTHITNWCWRRAPVQIGNHKCWFYPFLHPAGIMHDKKWREPREEDAYGSDDEFALAFYVNKALAEIDSLPEPIVHTPEQALYGLEIITGAEPDDLQKAIEFIRRLANEPIVGFDYETKKLHPYEDEAKLLSVALAGRKIAVGIALQHKDAKWKPDELLKLYAELKRFLYEGTCRKVAHNLSFEMEWTAWKFGRKSLRAQKWGDSVSQAWVLDERFGKGKCLSLDFLCVQYFGLHLKSINSDLDRDRLDEMPLDKVLSYNALDAKYHRLLFLAQDQRLRDEDLHSVYQHHVSRVPTMVLTKLKGIPINQSISEFFYKKYYKRRKNVEEKMQEQNVVKKFKKMTGKEFRPSAGKDIRFILEKILKLEVGKVDEKELSKISHPIAKLQLKWRKADKLLATYVLPFIDECTLKIDDEVIKVPKSPHLFKGKVHPSFPTNKTRTARTSSEEPNAQNQPKHGAGSEVRKQVKPGGDLRVVAFDFAGIQARNVAMESKDETLVKYFWNQYDIHSDWRDRIMKICPKWIDNYKKKEDPIKYARQESKNKLVFPTFFGAQPPSISRALQIPQEKAEELHEQFWAEFPDILQWHNRLRESFKECGYVTGLSGYRRRAPISPNELINSPIQADESKIVCSAMNDLSKYGELRYQANIEIHDDLTFIWPKHEIDKNAEIVIMEMLKKRYDWINVPIGVEMSVGEDWAALQKSGEYFSNLWNGHTIERKDLAEKK